MIKFFVNSMEYLAHKTASLLEILVDLFPKSTKGTVRSWIQKERILVNQYIVKKPHAEIQKGTPLKILSKKKYLPFDIKVLFEDKDLIVIEKPPKLLSVSTPYENEISVHQILKEQKQTVFPVHRLDRDTSGVMVFALNPSARTSFQMLFAQHAIIRQYHGLVEGNMLEKQGTWIDYLEEKEGFKMALTDEEKGKMAVTHFQVLSLSKWFTLLELTLETGRKNQIRVQASHRGFPIAGDKKYGATSNPLGRLALHATRLEFTHPMTGKYLAFYSPPPPTFKVHA